MVVESIGYSQADMWVLATIKGFRYGSNEFGNKDQLDFIVSQQIE